MKESEVWKRFSTDWPWYCERHEDGMSTGKPDVWLLGPTGRAGLVELKRPDKVVLRPAQWVWHSRWKRNGGKSAVLTCGTGTGNRVLWTVWDVQERTLKIACLESGKLEMVKILRGLLDI